MTLRNWLTLALTTFAGGAWAFVATSLGTGLPSTGAQWLSAVVGAVVAGIGAIVHLYQTSPPDLADKKAALGLGPSRGFVRFSTLVTFVAVFLITVGIYGAIQRLRGEPFLRAEAAGCSPAKGPTVTQVESVVLGDLASGKTLEQTEADVAQLYAGQAGVDVVAIVNDVLSLLIDAGVIPGNDVPKAVEWHTAETRKITARVR